MNLPNEQFWKVFKRTNGAFSTPEAIALYNICLQAPEGLYMELGSYHGKSTMTAALALKGGWFLLVDPIFKDQSVVDGIVQSMGEIGADKQYLTFIPDYSLNVIPNHSGLSFVFVDSGDHGEELVSAEIKLLEDRIITGGILAFHDFENQFTAVKRWYDYLLNTGKYEEIAINWNDIFDYARSNNLEEGNVSWHEKGSEEFPKFVGALKRK